MRPGRGNGRPAGGPFASFVLYVEGPRDRDVLVAWARRVGPRLAQELARASVILGGCRPARAREHFRDLRERDAATRGLCVLDRDAGWPEPKPRAEPGLDFFTWRRRHIESYLLVPAAIRRSLRLPPDDARTERLLRRLLPAAADEDSLATLDAKRLFVTHGLLARALGQPVAVGRVARAMLAEEMHAEVHALLDRIGRELGIRRAPEIYLRRG